MKQIESENICDYIEIGHASIPIFTSKFHFCKNPATKWFRREGGIFPRCEKHPMSDAEILSEHEVLVISVISE